MTVADLEGAIALALSRLDDSRSAGEWRSGLARENVYELGRLAETISHAGLRGRLIELVCRADELLQAPADAREPALAVDLERVRLGIHEVLVDLARLDVPVAA